MNKVLYNIEKTNVCLLVIFFPLLWIWGSREIAFSMFIGAFIVGANYWILKRAILRLVQTSAHKGFFLLLLSAKYLLLIGLLGGTIIFFDLQLVGLLVGVSTLVLSILWNTVLHGLI